MKYCYELLSGEDEVRDINALIGSLTFNNGVFTGRAVEIYSSDCRSDSVLTATPSSIRHN